MNKMKPSINGEHNIRLTDIFGKELKFKTCSSTLKRKKFLLITSLQFPLGVYDVWKSKDGDTLQLIIEGGRLIYEFSEGRYWLVRNYENEIDIINAFKAEHPSVFDVKFDWLISANFLTSIDTYRVDYLDNGYSFVKIDSTPVELDIEIPEEFKTSEEEADVVNDDVFRCDMTCPFQINGSCVFFETEYSLKLIDETPTCKEPFIYLENRK